MSTDEVTAVSALLHNGALPFPEAGTEGEHDVWNWLKQVTVEFDALRVTNAKLVSRVQQLERMTGGVEALNDEEFLAELPNRMSKALRSAQQVAHEIVKQATSREAALLQRATEDAAKIRREANAEARRLLERAAQDARAQVEEARRGAEEVAARAQAHQDHVLAELAAERSDLEREWERLETDRTYLRQVFVAVKRSLEGPSLQTTTTRPEGDEEVSERPSEPTNLRSPARPRPRHPRNGSRLARPNEARAQADAPVAVSQRQEDQLQRESRPRSSAGRPVKVLFVCGANVCASPMAALLLGRRLAELRIPAMVSSAGLAPRGQRPPAPVVQVLQARGLDVTGHKSVALNPQLLSEADLVLGMADQHVYAAAHLAPEAWPYTFTLKELVRCDQVMPRRRRDEPLQDLLALVHHARSQPQARSATNAASLGGGLGDYVADASEYSYEACARVAEELERLIDRLVAFLWWKPAEAKAAQPRRFFDDALS